MNGSIKNSEINRQKFDDYRGLLRNLTEEKTLIVAAVLFLLHVSVEIVVLLW